MRCDAHTAERIGAAWLRAAIAPVGDFGRRAEDAALPYGPADAVVAQERCGQIVGLAQRLKREGVALLRAALRRAPDPIDIVSRANAGDALTDIDFFEVGRFADALGETAQAWDAAGGPAADRPPTVPLVTALLARGREAGTFYLADSFAAGLAAARRGYAAADADLVRERARLAGPLAPLIGRVPDSEEFIVMRDLLPGVPPGVRVVRETPAYRLLALEFDAAALRAATLREAALARVGRAEESVRCELAAAIALHGPALRAAAEALGELDRTLARVAFTQSWGGCVPTVTPADFAFTQATFAPLRAALQDAALPYTPISLDLHGVAVLTGPNMGGKSAALATCGFLATCIANGVPPPAESARLPLLEFAAWIGGEAAADRTRLLSAFGGEVVRTRDALADSTGAPALLLVDEFARTTGPREGRALLVALVEAIARRGAFALVATHFDGVARDAHVPHFAIAGLGGRALDTGAARDMHAALDAVAQAMDYRIVVADDRDAGQSDALALAGLLGLDPPIVERAMQLFAADRAGPLRRFTE